MAAATLKVNAIGWSVLAVVQGWSKGWGAWTNVALTLHCLAEGISFLQKSQYSFSNLGMPSPYL